MGLSLNSARRNIRIRQLLLPGAGKGQLMLGTAPTGHSPCHEAQDQGSPCLGFGHCQDFYLQVTLKPPHRKSSYGGPLFICLALKKGPHLWGHCTDPFLMLQVQVVSPGHLTAHSSYPNRISHLNPQTLLAMITAPNIPRFPHHLLLPHSPSSGHPLIP